MSDMKKINCDQVAWLLDITDRHIPKDKHPQISRQREMQRYAMLYEIMDAAGLSFEDQSALDNGTPPDINIASARGF